MSAPVRPPSLLLATLGLTCALLPQQVDAGGSGLNTVVVVNQNSTNSLELGNYYCASRQVPPDNLLRISWPGPNTAWTSSDFQINLLQPLLNLLATGQLTNQADYVVLSMDIPFQTLNGTNLNSTTSALFYGLKPDTNGNANTYAGSEASFRLAKPATALGYSFLATMLTANSLAEAEQLVARGVSSDGAFPDQPVMLQKTSDPSRNVRYPEFDNAIFNVRILGRSSLLRTNSDSAPPTTPPLFGYQTGLANFSLSPNTFAPGALADSLTSSGGVIFGPNDQTSLLAFIAAGAAGSYGTVAEPFSDPQKFPNSQDYFYQARGFSLAECYYQSVYSPFLGLIVAEPLAAPFAQPAYGHWVGVASNAVLSGTSQLGVAFTARSSSLPLQQIDLFVDGKYFQTLTSLGPTTGNQLTLQLQGYPLSYTVPANATLATLTTGLVALINTPAISNLTKIKALAYGDRVELRSLSTNYQADPFYFFDSSATNGGPSYYRAAYLPYPPVPLMSAPALDPANGFRIHFETIPGVPQVVLASTNLADWSPIATNLLGGEMDFVDPTALSFARRFYRLASPQPQPTLSLAANSSGSFTLHVQTQAAVPYVVQVSGNLAAWTSIATNASGATMDLIDHPTPAAPARFYRAVLTPSYPPPATVTVLPPPPAGGNLVAVSGAARPYFLLASTNQVQWTPLLTNFALGGGQVSASSSAGTAPTLSTFLIAGRPALMDSAACGLRTFSVAGTAQSNSWIQLQITKTNGFAVSFGVTNLTGVETLASLAQQLVDIVNSDPGLQEPDGLVAEDFSASGWPSFHLRALTPGYRAAAISVLLTASSNLGLPYGGPVSLDQNLSDLQPRNHLYLTAGATTLAAAFALDTTLLPDGSHELTAVAYEGSHVRTQTRTVLPILVRNSPLSATLTFLDLSNNAPAQATYHLQVTANTNTASAISLFSNGGLLAIATKQSSATFSVSAAFLGAGLLPFYALVQTSDGLQYRTQPQWVRLVNGP